MVANLVTAFHRESLPVAALFYVFLECLVQRLVHKFEVVYAYIPEIKAPIE